jgi:hypothetical protein
MASCLSHLSAALISSFRRQLSFYRLKRSAVDALERTFQHFLDKVAYQILMHAS